MAKKGYWNEVYYPQPTASELKSNAEATAKKARKKGQKLSPVILKNKKIADSWWGKAWCDNLEQYADFSTRLERGQRYVRSGAVVDLQIQAGKITARVQGSRKIPYRVEIRISPLSQQHCDRMMEKCSEKVNSLEDLLSGEFPEELKDIFLGPDGLFPKPQQISFSCSCPDWAMMCKHVAAALYGVGARLDEDPLLFFTLRGLETIHFIDVVIANRIESMLANVEKPSPRIIQDASISELFGISAVNG